MKWTGCWSGRKEVTRREGRAVIEYARFADDLVVLVNSIPGMTGFGSGGEAATGGVCQARGRGERGEEPEGGSDAGGELWVSWV